MATETDAARDRVIAARADMEGELQALEASARAAVDIPAKIRRSPAKAAAVAGGVGFVAVKGPQRVFRGVKQAIRGKPDPLPPSMLPDEIEKSLRALGSDGAKVRGAIERDFAAYAKQAARDRTSARNLIAVTLARPLLARGAKVASEWILGVDKQSFGERLAQVQARAERGLQERDHAPKSAAAKGDDEPPTGV